MNTLIQTLEQQQRDWDRHYQEKLNEEKSDWTAWVRQSLSTFGSLGRLLCFITILTVVLSTLFVMITVLLAGEAGLNISDIQQTLPTVIKYSMIFATAGCMAVNAGQFKLIMRETAAEHAHAMAETAKDRLFIETIVTQQLKQHGLIEHASKRTQADEVPSH